MVPPSLTSSIPLLSPLFPSSTHIKLPPLTLLPPPKSLPSFLFSTVSSPQMLLLPQKYALFRSCFSPSSLLPPRPHLFSSTLPSPPSLPSHWQPFHPRRQRPLINLSFGREELTEERYSAFLSFLVEFGGLAYSSSVSGSPVDVSPFSFIPFSFLPFYRLLPLLPSYTSHPSSLFLFLSPLTFPDE